MNRLIHEKEKEKPFSWCSVNVAQIDDGFQHMILISLSD